MSSEQYTYCDYLEIPAPKVYILENLSYKNVDEYFKHLNANGIDCKIRRLNEVVAKSYDLILSEDGIKYLTEEDRSKLKEFSYPPQLVHNIPVINRFIDESYIDEFFNNGSLMLTTFERCKSLEDEIRRDDKEGYSHIIGHKNGLRIETETYVGADAFMLCGSLNDSYKKANGEEFKCYMEIFNIGLLIQEVCKSLEAKGFKVRNVLFGSCFYSLKKTFEKEIKSFDPQESLKKMDETKGLDMNLFYGMLDIAGTNAYFQKPREKSIENEFRLIWQVDPKPNDRIIVTIGNPQKIAKKIVL